MCGTGMNRVWSRDCLFCGQHRTPLVHHTIMQWRWRLPMQSALVARLFLDHFGNCVLFKPLYLRAHTSPPGMCGLNVFMKEFNMMPWDRSTIKRSEIWTAYHRIQNSSQYGEYLLDNLTFSTQSLGVLRGERGDGWEVKFESFEISHFYDVLQIRICDEKSVG